MAQLGQTAARGVAVTLLGQVLRFVVQLASLAVLSRLLAPTDFGKLAMVTAVIGVAAVVGDLGLSLAAVQATSLTGGQRSNLFWINAAVGLCVASLTVCLSGVLGWFYRDSDAPIIAIALSAVFVVNGLTAQFRAEITRRLGFAWLAFTDVSAQMVGLVGGVIVALTGGGYWALVVQQIGVAVATSLLTVFGSAWRPGWPRRDEEMRSLLRFGTATTATQFINYISANIDSMTIGRVWGAADLGVYSRVFQIFSLPLQQIAAPITRVALPILSGIKSESQYLAFAQRAQKVLAYVLLPALAMMAVASEPLLTALLGHQWTKGAPILSVLALGGVFQGLGYVYYWIFLSRNQMTVLLSCELTGRVLMIVGILIVAPFGIVWVAVAVSGGLVAVWCVVGIFGLPKVGLRMSQFVVPVLNPFILASTIGAMGMVTMAVQRDLGLQPWVQLALVGAVSGCVAVAGVAFPPMRRDYRLLIETVKMVRRGSEAAAIGGMGPDL